MKLACCNELFGNTALHADFDAIMRAGYKAVEIAPFTIWRDVRQISSEQRQYTKDCTENLGLKVVGLHWLLAQTEGFHVNHPDAKIRKSTTNYMIDLVKFCHDIGGKIMVWGSPKQRDVLDEVNYEIAWSWAVASIREVAKAAYDHGISFCVEPLSPDQTNFLTSASDAVRFIQEVDHPACRLILDCYSMRTETKPRGELIREHARYLDHVHANDLDKRGPGMCENGIDFVEVFAALRDINYDGFVSVEPFVYEPSPSIIAKESIEHLLQCMEQTGIPRD